mmetsp:Transcript_86718/g.240526  ORF Transcript_86718/g.240526 Transcript_86718/m.240526 type:complete len:83 (+) Transcript_86718:912-1160(+)
MAATRRGKPNDADVVVACTAGMSLATTHKSLLVKLPITEIPASNVTAHKLACRRLERLKPHHSGLIWLLKRELRVLMRASPC